MNKERFKQIYDEVYEMFLEENQDLENPYRKREWIFPNHIDLVIDYSKKLSKKYKANMEVCVIAALLHDTGLVYKRAQNTSPKGHENRSLEYTRKILIKYDFSDNFIEKVIACINATEPENKPKTIEEKVVKTSDGLAQYNSIHFFAKASFSNNWDYFYKWFSKKIESNYKKICLLDERKQVKLIYEHYKNIVEKYKN